MAGVVGPEEAGGADGPPGPDPSAVLERGAAAGERSGPGTAALARWGRRAALLLPLALVALTVRSYVATSLYPPCPAAPAVDEACFGRDPGGVYARAQALALASGRLYVDPTQPTDRPGARVGPWAPTMAALARSVGFGDAGGDRVLPLLLGSLAVVAVGLTAWRMAEALAAPAGPIAAVAATSLAVVWPPSWSADALGRPDAWLVPVAAVTIWLLARLWSGPSTGRAVAAGAVVGVGCLVRVDGVVVALVAAAALIVVGPRGVRPVRLAAWVLAAAAVVVAPWAIANVVRFGEVVPLGTGVGPALAEASCPAALSGPGLGSREPSCLPPPTGDELGDERAAWDVVQGGLADDPGRLVVAAPVRAARLWGVVGVLDSIEHDQTVEASGVAAGLGWVALWIAVPLAVVGLVALRRRGQPLAPLLVLPVAATVVAVLGGGISRMRIGADVAVIVAAGVGVAAVVAWLRRGRATSRPVVAEVVGA